MDLFNFRKKSDKVREKDESATNKNEGFNEEFAETIAEGMLCGLIWLKIENIITKGFPNVEKLFSDDKKNILAIKSNQDIYVAGYLHLYQTRINEKKYQNDVANGAVEFANDLIKLAQDRKWNPRIMLITTFPLSKMKSINFYHFPKNVGYCYIESDSDISILGEDDTIKLPEFNIAKDVIDFTDRQAEATIEHWFKMGEEISKQNQVDFNRSWYCDICDGTNETGCLYFDLSECPRHT